MPRASKPKNSRLPVSQSPCEKIWVRSDSGTAPAKDSDMRSILSKSLTAVLVLPLLVLTGCPRDREDPLTLGEATAALEQASDAGQAEGLTSASVDISTNFTIGQAVKDGAAELKTFIGTQLPCAEVTLEDATLTVVYGAKAGNCTYRGHTFSGTHSISLERNDDAQVDVHHEWTDFSNGVVTLDGTADVTWNLADKNGVGPGRRRGELGAVFARGLAGSRVAQGLQRRAEQRQVVVSQRVRVALHDAARVAEPARGVRGVAELQEGGATIEAEARALGVRRAGQAILGALEDLGGFDVARLIVKAAAARDVVTATSSGAEEQERAGSPAGKLGP
jgi:hypothetical protein